MAVINLVSTHGIVADGIGWIRLICGDLESIAANVFECVVLDMQAMNLSVILAPDRVEETVDEQGVADCKCAAAGINRDCEILGFEKLDVIDSHVRRSRDSKGIAGAGIQVGFPGRRFLRGASRTDSVRPNADGRIVRCYMRISKWLILALVKDKILNKNGARRMLNCQNYCACNRRALRSDEIRLGDWQSLEQKTDG